MTQLAARTQLCACRWRFWRNATCDLIWSRTGLVSDTSAAAGTIVSGLRGILMQIGFLMKFSTKIGSKEDAKQTLNEVNEFPLFV